MPGDRTIEVRPARIDERPVRAPAPGLALLPIAALLFFAVGFVRGPFYSPAFVADEVNYGRWLESTGFVIGCVLHLAAFAALLVGTAALGLMLRRRPDGSMARAGMWLAIGGVVIQLALVAAMLVSWPSFGRELATGNVEAIARLRASYQNGLFLGAAAAGTGLYVVGAMLLSVPIWRAPDLPRWTAPLYALHAPLVTLAASFLLTFEQLGAFFLLASTGYLYWDVIKRRPHPPQTDFERREITA
jgi:hypothetical protein